MKENHPGSKNGIDFRKFKWMNEPVFFSMNGNVLLIETEPETDFWQRTYYGFSKNNAPAFLTETEGDFSFSVKVSFKGNEQYDQCGILLYYDEHNWAKIAVEAENDEFSRLGSVVTNSGYSDWASTDIPSYVDEIWYRLSRKGRDFLVEFSENGVHFRQMRMFHFHQAAPIVRTGVYACSPMKSGFRAVFSEFRLGPGEWV